MSMRDKLQEAKERLIVAQGGNVETIQQEVDQKTAETLAKYGLDLEHATDAYIKKANAQNIRKVRSELMGNGLLKAGLTFGGSVTERAHLGYLSALVEQNWILMRQNELIIRQLDRLAEK